MNTMQAMPPARRVALPGGGWLNVHEQPGSGPGLLLLHGFTDCAESFRLLLPQLVGCHLVIPDLRGHGASFRGRIDGLATFAEDVEVVAAALGLTRVVLVGHSMGALIALTLAARGNLAVDALMTVSGSLRPGGAGLQSLAAGFEALPCPLPDAHPFFETWYACDRSVPLAFIATLRASFTAMRREDLIACLGILDTADLRRDAGAITLPSIAVFGASDPIFPLPHHRELIAELQPSRSVTLPSGHNPHWELPGEVGEILRTLFAPVLRTRVDPTKLSGAPQ